MLQTYNKHPWSLPSWCVLIFGYSSDAEVWIAPQDVQSELGTVGKEYTSELPDIYDPWYVRHLPRYTRGRTVLLGLLRGFWQERVSMER